MTKAEKYKTELLEAIKKHEIMRFEHAFGGFVSFSKKTAYNHKLHEVPDIREAIEGNRASAKQYMIQKWILSDNPTLQVAAFRLLSDPEEHMKLNQQYIDHTSKGNEMKIIVKPPTIDGD
jgi:hypothetical protein